MDWKTLINLKRELKGSDRDGTVSSEVDVTIPSGRRFLARYKRELHIKSSEPSSGEGYLLLEDHSDGQVRSSSLKVSAKGVDVKHGAFDSAVEYSYKSPSGKDLNANMIAKNTYAGDGKWIAEGTVWE